MSAPSTDQAGIRQTIRALRAAGYELTEVFDGEDRVLVQTEADALDAITAVEDAYLFVTHSADPVPHTWVRFVLGNDPEEVVCDYTTNLEDVIGPLTESWWS